MISNDNLLAQDNESNLKVNHVIPSALVLFVLKVPTTVVALPAQASR
jgi:hypothetical protein